MNLVVLRVLDRGRAQRFDEALGLRFQPARHGTGPEHLAAELAGAVFELYPRGSGPPTAGVRLGFRVASVLAVVSAVPQLGAEGVSPPADSPWGLRAVLVDPEGHRVEVTEARAGPNQPLQPTGAAGRLSEVYCLLGGPGC